MEIQGTVNFKTKEAAAVWTGEILGQLSDGHWENTRPYDHWKFWHHTNINIGDTIGWSSKEGFRPIKTNYSITALNRNSTVKERMINFIKFAKSCFATDENVKNCEFIRLMTRTWMFEGDDKQISIRMNKIFGSENAQELADKRFNDNKNWYLDILRKESSSEEDFQNKLEDYKRNILNESQCEIHFREITKKYLFELGINNAKSFKEAWSEIQKINVTDKDLKETENEIKIMLSKRV